jgi:hypothetical protein
MSLAAARSPAAFLPRGAPASSASVCDFKLLVQLVASQIFSPEVRMRLSRAQSIGVFASALWATTSFGIVSGIDYSRAQQQVQVTRILCKSLDQKKAPGECAANEQRTWDNWTSLTTLKALGVAFLPIPFAWVFGEWVGDRLQRRREQKGSRFSWRSVHS